MVPAGGLSLSGDRWVSLLSDEAAGAAAPGDRQRRKPYLINVQALSALFRGKFLSGLRALHAAGELKLGGELASLTDPSRFASFLSPLYQKCWGVYCQAPTGAQTTAEGGLKYVARYVSGVAVANPQLIS